jgi:prefoldin subunit 5
MKKQKFVYNPNTLQYEKAKLSIKGIIFRVLGFTTIVLLIAASIAYLLYTSFPSAKEQDLERELTQLQYNYDLLNDQITTVSKVLSNIKERDEGVYNLMLGVEPIDPSVWEVGTGGHITNSRLMDFGNSTEVIKETKDALGKLEKQVVLFSKSLDNVENLARQKSDRLASIPSIKPVREDKLKREITLLSGFGMRMHPVHNILKMHSGLDFTCPTGTVVRTTGDGTVKRIENRRTGYGKNILIDHGYGYETRYAHLSAIDVKVGDKVEKGQAIGEVGNTGTSTAPHLHYEVMHNGKAVDPIDFVLDGLTPQEYADLVNKASQATQSFD